MGTSQAFVVASEVRGEFQNIYNLINGNIDTTNIADGGISTADLADGSVTNNKIATVDGSKITGVIGASQIPGNVVTDGKVFTGSIVFNVPYGTPMLKTYNTYEQIVVEGGTSSSYFRIQMSPTGDVFKVIVNGTILFKVDSAGVAYPTKLVLPSGTGLW